MIFDRLADGVDAGAAALSRALRGFSRRIYRDGIDWHQVAVYGLETVMVALVLQQLFRRSTPYMKGFQAGLGRTAAPADPSPPAALTAGQEEEST